MVMMDQYKQETSQIHAPADLIRRTKEAVRVEELRLRQEQAQSATTAGSGSISAGIQDSRRRAQDRGREQQQADRSFRIHSGRIYRWALPVAAAAMVLLLINIASIMVGNRFGKSSSNAPMETAMDDSAAYDTAEAAAEEPEEFEPADTVTAGQENGAGAMPDQSMELSESKQTDADLYDNGADMSANSYAFAEEAAEACEDDSIQEGTIEEAANGGAEAAAGDMGLTDLSVIKVTEIPAFVDNEDTKCVMVHGIRVYVAKEANDQWSAYARVNQVNYLITGGEDVTDADDYAVKAYERITETVEEE